MFFRALRDLARPQILAIVDTLKRSDGLAVGDIAESLKMSYMGVKQYCIELEKRGYLDTWRRPRETGRPELTYRLTPKAQVLFPQQATELCLDVLEAVRQLHGATAADKILYQYFLKKTDAYAKKIKGQSLIERATSLAKLRDAEGLCAQVDSDATHGVRLTEYHSPLAELIQHFPSVARMEEAMISRLLQVPVQREATSVAGLMRLTFLVAGATQPPPAPPATGVRSRPTAHRRKKTTSRAVPEPPCPPSVETPGSMAAAGEPLVTNTEMVSPDVPAAQENQPSAPPPADISPMEPAAETARTAAEHQAEAEVADQPDSGFDLVEPTGTPPIPTPPSLEHAPVEPPAIDRRDAEPFLFATLESPAPRHGTRTVAPAKPAAKPTAPVAEELFLSL